MEKFIHHRATEPQRVHREGEIFFLCAFSVSLCLCGKSTARYEYGGHSVGTTRKYGSCP
ncbi:hypothetical protein MTBUT4_540007 [Magnetospirillum sp. UT-4]|nr:hypothetical protein MTBUT4_540007 [Magnetospirillum sp. UT-4]